MKVDLLIKNLEKEFDRLYFMITRCDDGDVKVIGFSKSVNDIKISFSYDEKQCLIYCVNISMMGFYEIKRFIEVINNVIS